MPRKKPLKGVGEKEQREGHPQEDHRPDALGED